MYRCPKCQIELAADARFCKNCGFNQTNARMASMPPSAQGVQRQVPPTPPVRAQQAPPRTIQPNNRHIPQQQSPNPNNTQGRSQQPAMNTQVRQQDFPSSSAFMQQGPPRVAPTPQNVSPAMPPVTPRFPQEGPVQGNNGMQQPVRQPMSTPQQSALPVTPQSGTQTKTLSDRGQQVPVSPQQQAWGRQNQGVGYVQEQVVRTSTPPPTLQRNNIPSTPLEPLQWGLGRLPPTPVANQESLAATSRAALHWRQSWLDRQHDEAGPAVGVSRGQAAVPEPLLKMQNSLVRMRAIILPKNGKDGKVSRLGFLFPVIMLVCLIGGLGAYILSTYSGGLFGANLASAGIGGEPTLTMKTIKKTTITAGQSVRVHGSHFGQDDKVLFFLNNTPVAGTGGKLVSAQSNDRGVFDVTIPTTQLAGEYTLEARDSHTGQHAFLTIQTTTSTTTNAIKLSVPSLSFTAIVNQNNLKGQDVSITNISNAAIDWQATALSDNQAGWLILNGGKTSDTLQPGMTDTMHVNVLTEGLTSNTANHPYTGEVIVTVTGQGQVTLPVKLVVSETAAEVAISPNPIVAVQSAIPGGCQDTALTLINLSDTDVHWNVQTDGFSQQFISLDGKPGEQGTLTASGSLNDTKVIKIGCSGVQLDKAYAVNVYYNGNQQLVPISITQG